LNILRKIQFIQILLHNGMLFLELILCQNKNWITFMGTKGDEMKKKLLKFIIRL
jgi:hypothetical protein